MAKSSPAPESAKTRKVSRRVRHKRRYNMLNKYPHKNVGLKPSTIVRIYKRQTKRLEKGSEKHLSIFCKGLERVPRLSKRSSELAASLFEKECSNIFQNLRSLAAHAGRKTVKLEDVHLHLQEQKA